jgi:hypothetical protein
MWRSLVRGSDRVEPRFVRREPLPRSIAGADVGGKGVQEKGPGLEEEDSPIARAGFAPGRPYCPKVGHA